MLTHYQSTNNNNSQASEDILHTYNDADDNHTHSKGDNADHTHYQEWEHENRSLLQTYYSNLK
jgi:hypothetical protein